MKSVQRIVIGAQIFRQACTSDCLLNIAAETQAIDDSSLNSKPDNSTCVLIHHHEHPIRLQADRFTSEQVDIPQTVLHVTDERQPGWTVVQRRRPEMQSQNPPNHVLINRCSESQIDLLGNLRTSQFGLRCFISTTAWIKSAVGTLWPRFCSLFWRKQQPILALHHRPMKTQERRRLERDRRTTTPRRRNPKGTESRDQAIQDAEIRRTSP